MYSKFSDGFKAKVLSYYTAPHTLRETEEEFDLTRGELWTIVSVAPPRRKGWKRLSQEEKDAILTRWESGDSKEKIGRELGVHRTVVARFLAESGITMETRYNKGDRHHAWQGGRVTDGNGYVWVRIPEDHMMFPDAYNGRYVLEHRLVMAESLGRPLKSTETVHHINGNRQDNRIENLQLRQGRHGKGSIHRCADCGSYNVVTEAIAT